MSEWQEYTIGSLGTVITGKTPSKSMPEEWGSEYLFITPTDYSNYNKYAFGSIRKLSENGYSKHVRRKIPINSSLVTCIGSDMGKVVKNSQVAFTNQQINTFIPNSKLVNHDYVYYFFKNAHLLLKALGSDGTAVPILNKSDFEKISITIPSITEQKAIASVLSSLDDKIDLLHRQNKTLESMAETLFRQWFVEEAQEDWDYTEVGNVLNTSSGGTPSRQNMAFYSAGENYWVKSKELNCSLISNTEEMITDDAINNSSAKILPPYSILVAMYGATVGEYALTTTEMACNQAICAIKHNENYPYTFLFMYFKNKKQELINSAIGSAQQNINQITIKKLSIPTCFGLIRDYHHIALKFFRRMELNTYQIKSLESLRDTLLPKLISGEVRVKYEESQD